MRVALYEIEHEPTSRSRSRSTRRSRSPRSTAAPTRPSFVNGILGAIVREREPASERVSRLREISDAPARDRRPSWRASEAGDERAAELAAEAAELSAEAVEEANRRAREAASAE